MAVPKLSEIGATLAELKSFLVKFAGDKTTATDTALAGFQTKLTALETDTVAQVTQLSEDLTKAQASIKSISTEKETLATEKAGIIAALDAACVALKIEGGDTAKISAMTPAAKIAAMQSGVTDTLAKLQVPAASIPAAKPSDKPAAEQAKAKGRELFVSSVKILN